MNINEFQTPSVDPTAPLDFHVITNRGNIPISNIKPGDFVYHYRDGHPMEVDDIKKYHPGMSYNVIYSDRRVTKYHELHSILYDSGEEFNDDSIATVVDLVNHSGNSDVRSVFGTIRQFKIDWPYNYSLDRTPGSMLLPHLGPDPYLAGPFIIYGDFREKYVNLPDMEPMKSFVRENFIGINGIWGNTIWAGNDHVTKIFLTKCDGIGGESLLTWEDIFPSNEYKFYHEYRGNMLVTIPDQYMYITAANRMEFIRGVFDCGYYHAKFPDGPGIINNDAFRLKAFQKILLSMGIYSEINHDPILHATIGMGSCLSIIGNARTDVFRMRKYITNMLDADNQDVNAHKPFKLVPVIFREDYVRSSFDIILRGEDRYGVYLSSNFIPRPSH